MNLPFTKKPWFIKLTNWEYWSFNAVYFPVLFYYGWLSLKARSFSFFNAANPSIQYGGFLMESKWDIHQILPPAYTPSSIIVRKDEQVESVIKKCAPFTLPFICKPDNGSRGRGVAVIHNYHELEAYHNQCPVDYLVQEKVDYEKEAGIFYVRIPGEAKGRITGIVEKKFLAVTGDGISTIRQLVMNNKRYLLQLPSLTAMLGNQMEEVPAKKEKRVLVPFGNHARGCLFINATSRANEKLTTMIDELCKRVEGFFYGRIDIKFDSWEKLEKGEDFAIIELNGSGSEPTHMYDPGHSIFRGWKEIIKHWNWMYKVSRVNHKEGVPYLTAGETKKMFRDNAVQEKKLNGFLFIPPALKDILTMNTVA
jgi:hypothetical protein